MTRHMKHVPVSPLTIPLHGPLRLDWTLESGQAFRWRPVGDAYSGAIGPHLYVLRQVGDALYVQTTAPADAVAPTLRRYLRLDDDLDAVHAALAPDPVLAPLLARWRGLRLLQVPPWECLVGFICSTQNNVRRIGEIMERLSVAFGAPVTVGEVTPRARGEALIPVRPAQGPRSIGEPVEGAEREDSAHLTAFPGPVGITRHTFPSAPALAEAGEAAMRKLGLGYRAAFVDRTASLVARGEIDLDEVALRWPYEEARRLLLELPGVGEKVADCVLLYAGRRDEAFPVDRWVRRALDRWYVGGRGFRKYEDYRAWAVAHFGPYAGYAQQYLFQELRMEERQTAE